MPARRRELKPDSKGRYRPYLGFRLDEMGNRKEHRFNLGTDYHYEYIHRPRHSGTPYSA